MKIKLAIIMLLAFLFSNSEMITEQSFTIQESLTGWGIISAIFIGVVSIVGTFALFSLNKISKKVDDVSHDFSSGLKSGVDRIHTQMEKNDTTIKRIIEANAEEARHGRKAIHEKIEGVQKDMNGLGTRLTKVETEIKLHQRLGELGFKALNDD